MGQALEFLVLSLMTRTLLPFSLKWIWGRFTLQAEFLGACSAFLLRGLFSALSWPNPYKESSVQSKRQCIVISLGLISSFLWKYFPLVSHIVSCNETSWSCSSHEPFANFNVWWQPPSYCLKSASVLRMQINMLCTLLCAFFISAIANST